MESRVLSGAAVQGARLGRTGCGAPIAQKTPFGLLFFVQVRNMAGLGNVAGVPTLTQLFTKSSRYSMLMIA